MVENGLEEAQEITLAPKHREPEEDENGENEFSPFKFAIYCALIWIVVMGLGTLAFLVDSVRYPSNSPEITTWLSLLQKHGCGDYTYSDSFHNKMFVNVGMVTFPMASMVIFSYRKFIGVQLFYHYRLQDGSNISDEQEIAACQVGTRVATLALLLLVYFLAGKSGQLIQDEPSTSIGNRFMTMFETQIFPLLTIAYLLNSGIYDLIADVV